MKILGDAIQSQPDSAPPRAGWDYFDRIYCISLAARPDRRQQAEVQFARAGLAGMVEFRIFEKHPTDAEEGIFNSHMDCLRAGLSGSGNILIFEDDVEFHGFSPQVLQDATRFMQEHKDWQVFFLGCFVNSSRKTQLRSVVQVKFRCLAHAYIIRREFAQTLLKNPWSGIAFDDLLRQAIEPGRAYALYPAIAFQSDSPTDNNKTPVIDRIRRLLGGVRRLQRWNEFSNRHLAALIAAHLVAAATLVIVFLLCRKIMSP